MCGHVRLQPCPFSLSPHLTPGVCVASAWLDTGGGRLLHMSFWWGSWHLQFESLMLPALHRIVAYNWKSAGAALWFKN